MKLTLTERDRKLLIFLAFFLVAFVFGYLIILPLFEKGQELSNQIATAESQKRDISFKLENYETLRQARDSKQKELEALKADIFEEMQVTEIDNLLTEMAFKNKVVVQSLTIQMPSSAITQLQDYEALVYKNSSDEAEESGEDEFSGIGCVQVSLVLSGTKDALTNIVDTYLAMEPKLRANSINYSISDEGKGTVALNIDLYMLMSEEE